MRYELKLYILGESSNSEKAVRDIKKVLKRDLGSSYKLDIIDISKHPEIAEKENILAIPTVKKVAPTPEKKIIGDLSNPEEVFMALNIKKETKENNGK